MKILFAGTPYIAVPALEAIAETHTIAGVLTNPDRPKGRGKKPVPSPVKEKAVELGLETIECTKIDASVRKAVKEKGADLLVVAAFGKIFDTGFLDLFPNGGINLHPSILPKYRGPSPIPAAIVSREEQTGVTVQQLALEMDSGDILAQEIIPLNGTETADAITEQAAQIGARLLVTVIADIENGTVKPVPQDDSEATYCRLLKKEDGLIDWNTGAREISAMVRAFFPWPKAYTYFDGRKLDILYGLASGQPGPEASGPNANSAVAGEVLGIDKRAGILIQTGYGILAVTHLQLEAKKALDWRSFLNGTHGFIGSKLGETG
jgi:methionyl-tRNA formyltransferase